MEETKKKHLLALKMFGPLRVFRLKMIPASPIKLLVRVAMWQCNIRTLSTFQYLVHVWYKVIPESNTMIVVVMSQLVVVSVE